MIRERNIELACDSSMEWDLVIIGGGATGLGAGVEAASRGYRTLLLEQYDFSRGTSSRSTKLVHGGVRYLAQGNIPLVMEALRERGLMKKNAGHLVRDQAFVIPCYKWWCVPFFTIGLTLYDLLAGKLGIGRSVPLSRSATMGALPCIRKKGLRGGVRYYDCQFDDSRMAINLAQTMEDHGGKVLNYCRVTGLIKDQERIKGVRVLDTETGREFQVRSKGVINACGVFVDSVLRMDCPDCRDVVKPSQGIHLVLDRRFLGGGDALMIPKTSDGRVLFAVPWHDRVVVGTTDVEKEHAEIEPLAEEEEVRYIMETAGRFMEPAPAEEDVLSVFTGLRPLAAPASEGKKTKEISRGHQIIVSESGLVTIFGGKWTTYRKMGVDVVGRAAIEFSLPSLKSRTMDLKIHGHLHKADTEDPLGFYGADAKYIRELVKTDAILGEKLSKLFNVSRAQVVWAVRKEMARSVEDFLARRCRILQLDAIEGLHMAPEVAKTMARELGKDRGWEKDQVEAFRKLTDIHLLNH